MIRNHPTPFHLIAASLIVALALPSSFANAACSDPLLHQMQEGVTARQLELASRSGALKGELGPLVQARDASDSRGKAIEALKFSALALGLGSLATPIIQRISGASRGKAALAATSGASALIVGRQIINSLVGAASTGVAAGDRSNRLSFRGSSQRIITLSARGMEELSDRQYSAAAADLTLIRQAYEAGHQRIRQERERASLVAKEARFRVAQQTWNFYEVRRQDLEIETAARDAHRELIQHEQDFLAVIEGKVEGKCRLEVALSEHPAISSRSGQKSAGVASVASSNFPLVGSRAR